LTQLAEGHGDKAFAKLNYFLPYHEEAALYTRGRDGPKFGRRRSSAEEFGRMFGSARQHATIRPKFGHKLTFGPSLTRGIVLCQCLHLACCIL